MTDERAVAYEAEQIAAAQQGDLKAFNVLVQMYEQRLFNLTARMLGDHALAADVTQQTFVSAWRNIRSFRGGIFRAWLTRIATNACYDALRAQQRQPAVSLDALQQPDHDDTPGIEIADSAATPDEIVLRREQIAQIQAAILQLPPDQRAVLVLCDVQDYAYQEVAEILNINVGTVKSRLSRARMRLRELFVAQELFPSVQRPLHDVPTPTLHEARNG